MYLAKNDPMTEMTFALLSCPTDNLLLISRRPNVNPWRYEVINYSMQKSGTYRCDLSVFRTSFSGTTIVKTNPVNPMIAKESRAYKDAEAPSRFSATEIDETVSHQVDEHTGSSQCSQRSDLWLTHVDDRN